VRFEGRIQGLVETIPDLAILVEPPLVVRRAPREQIIILHHRLLAIVRSSHLPIIPTAGLLRDHGLGAADAAPAHAVQASNEFHDFARPDE